MARTRFAISPMFELARSLQALRDPSQAALHLPWLRSLSGRLDGIDLRPVIALVPVRGYTPDFLTPPPEGPLGDVEAELARVRATHADTIREEMTIFRRANRAPRVAAPWLEHPRRQLARTADTLEAFWERALAPHWPRIRSLLDADLAHRARRLTDGGAGALFSDLHPPSVQWRGDHLDVGVSFDSERSLDGKGLLLMPSAFQWPGPSIISRAPWQPTLVYPARGVAGLWEEGRASSAGLARVVGAARAQLLELLDAPRSTTELARLAGLTPGGASQHLTALRDAGLLTSRREGRSVLYLRTPVADALLAPGGDAKVGG
jgi:DNA-binding transcriptional ArsR family regulator